MGLLSSRATGADSLGALDSSPARDMIHRSSLAALGLAFVAWATACADSGAAAAEDRITQEWVEALRDEVLVALADGAQIELPEPVEIVVLTATEAKERREAFAEDVEDHRGLTAAVDIFADLMFSDRMLGRYLPDEKVIYVISNVVDRYARGGLDAAEDLLFSVMAHEIVHAYDDQVYDVVPEPSDLFELLDSGAQLPELQSLMSLLEGRATYAAELAAKAAGREPMEPPTMEDVERLEIMRSNGGVEDAAAGAVNVIARTKLAQYVMGREFAEDAYNFGGEKFFRHVFTSLPVSMGELGDFERFRQRWAEDMLAAMEAEEEAAEADAEASIP